MLISSTGDLGDCVFLLNLIRQIPGGPHTLCLRSSNSTKAKGDEGVQRLYDTIAPLALQQPYIKDVRIVGASFKVDWRSEDFRQRHYTKGETLMRAHLNHLVKMKGIGEDFTDSEPWLTVEPSDRSKGRVVINRTGRYRNPWFPWEAIVRHYRHRLLFVGLLHEWREFIGHHGYVEYQPTANLLEVARLIAGSDLFIGNQSCANACAEGLKHNLIQETNLTFPDCIYNRPNAQFVGDGNVLLPDGTRLLPLGSEKLEKRTHVVPPRQWQYPGYPPMPDFDLLVGLVVKNEKLQLEVASDLVYRANLDRCPDFFNALMGKNREMVRYEQAMQRKR